MPCKDSTCGPGDLTGSPVRWIVWGVPALLVAAGLVWSGARLWLWAPSFAVAGVACLANAARCGRVHCYLTGPLFLLAAAATLAGGLGVLAVPAGAILAVAVLGTAAGYGLEWARGHKYTDAHRSSP